MNKLDDVTLIVPYLLSIYKQYNNTCLTWGSSYLHKEPNLSF